MIMTASAAMDATVATGMFTSLGSQLDMPFPDETDNRTNKKNVA